MKKGFSLIELVIVIALVGILLSVASLSTKNVLEKRALEEAKTGVSGVMRSYIERSFHEGEVYKVIVDATHGLIEVRDSSDLIKEKLELPQSLNYLTSGDGVTLGEMTTTVESGSEFLEVYIRNGSGEEKYKVKMLKNIVTSFVTVDVYEYTGDWEKE